MLYVRRVAAVSVLAFAGLLLFSSQASATNFCAVASGSLPDCTAPNTYSGAGTAVNSAINQAAASPGADRVIIGSGTFTTPNNSSFSYNGGGLPGNTVEIYGQGPTTVLQNLGVPASKYVLILFASTLTNNSVHDLKVNIPSSAGTGVTGIVVSTNSPTDISNVTVTAPSAQAGTVGVSLGSPGSVLRSSTIDIARFGVATQGTYGAVSAVTSGTAPVIRDSTISADYGVSAGAIPSSATDEKVTARNLRITATTGVTTNQTGHVTVDNSVIRLLPDAVSPSLYDSVGLSSFAFLSGSTAQLTGRHITVIGGSGTRDVGAQAYAVDAGANVDLLLTDSVISNVETSLKRRTNPGMATASAEYSSYDSALVDNNNSGGGGGTLDQSIGNINVNPGFTNASGGDFSLTSTSALIDKGNPAAPDPGEPTTDIAGSPRVVDGNGDGTTRSDIGAFEFQPAVAPPGDTTPPNTILGKFKKKAKAGKKVKFKFSSDDPQATFTCAYDDGSPKKCSSPYTLKRLKKGKHKLTITSMDAAGNIDPTPVVAKFKVKAKKK